MLICPKCSYSNELGRIFCHQCGAKLDLDKIKPTSGGRIIRRKGTGLTKRLLRTGILILVLGAIAGGFFAVLHVPDIQPVKSTNAELLAAENKRLGLEQMILQSKAKSMDFTMEITPQELNTYISSLGLEKREGSGARIVPITLQVELGDGTMKLNLLGMAKFGDALSKRIFVSYTGVPAIEGGRFAFKPVSATIGKMPIHPRILESTSFVQNLFARLMAKLGHEKDLLDQLTSIKVDRGHVMLMYRPKKEAAKPAAR